MSMASPLSMKEMFYRYIQTTTADADQDFPLMEEIN